MDLLEFYNSIDGNYEEVKERLVLDRIIEKNLIKFLDDKSLEKARIALEEKDLDAAFVAAHTLKGISGTLGFPALFEKASKLSENLKSGNGQDAQKIMKEIEFEHSKVVELIEKL